jgi:hypothetical protein
MLYSQILSSKAKIQSIIKLKFYFKLKDLGFISFLLGMKVTKDLFNHSNSLFQTQYIVDMLAKYGFSDCISISTPINPGLVLQKTQKLSDEDISGTIHLPKDCLCSWCSC